MCGEREDAYTFMCQFLLRNSPGRPAEDVNVVAGDGFFNQSMVHCFEFPNAKYLTGWFHLFQTGLTDRFSEYGYGLIQSELCQMIKSKSEGYFDAALTNARLKLI